MANRDHRLNAAYFQTKDLHYHSAHTLNIFRSPISSSVEQLALLGANLRNQGQQLSIGDRIRELYWSTLQYEDDQQEWAWEFVRVLGYGSFGIVALYQKRLDDGELVDVCTMCSVRRIKLT